MLLSRIGIYLNVADKRIIYPFLLLCFMPVAVDEKNQLTSLIGRTFQDAKNSLLIMAINIQAYLEKKYKCKIQDMDESSMDMKDVEVLSFLTQAKMIVRNFNEFDLLMAKLPETADAILDMANAIHAQARSLMRACEVNLAIMGASAIGIAENQLLVIVTDMIDIQKFARELVASLSRV
jgi:hypothetical protein